MLFQLLLVYTCLFFPWLAPYVVVNLNYFPPFLESEQTFPRLTMGNPILVSGPFLFYQKTFRYTCNIWFRLQVIFNQLYLVNMVNY